VLQRHRQYIPAISRLRVFAIPIDFMGKQRSHCVVEAVSHRIQMPPVSDGTGRAPSNSHRSGPFRPTGDVATRCPSPPMRQATTASHAGKSRRPLIDRLLHRLGDFLHRLTARGDTFLRGYAAGPIVYMHLRRFFVGETEGHPEPPVAILRCAAKRKKHLLVTPSCSCRVAQRKANRVESVGLDFRCL